MILLKTKRPPNAGVLLSVIGSVLSAVRTHEFMAPAGRFSIIRGVERAERGQGEAASRPTMDRFVAATPSNGAEPTALRLRRRGQCDLWDDRVSGL